MKTRLASIGTTAEKENENKRQYFFFNILLALFTIDSFLLSELPAFIGFPSLVIWSPWLYGLLSFAFLLFLPMLVAYARIAFGFVPSRFLCAIFALLLLGYIATNVSAPSSFVSSADLGSPIVVPDAGRFYFKVGGLPSLLSVFVLLAYAPIGRKDRLSWTLFYEFIILMAFFSLIFSLIKEWDIYAHVFSEKTLYGWSSPVSWTPHKNAYGRYLLLGIMAEIYLIHDRKQSLRYIPAGLLLFALLLTMAKTPLLIAGALFVISLVFSAIRFGKERRLALMGGYVFILLILAILVILVCLSPTDQKNVFSDIVIAIRYHLINQERGSIHLRIELWKRCLGVCLNSPRSIVLGYGDYSYPLFISNIMDSPSRFGSSHNALLEIFGRGGIVRVVFTLILFGYVLVRLIKKLKRKQRGSLLMVFFLLGYLANASFEAQDFTILSIETIFMHLLIFVPILSSAGEEEPCVNTQPSIHISSSSLFILVVLSLPSAILASYVFLPSMVSALVVFLLGTIQIWITLKKTTFFSILALITEVLFILLTVLFPMKNTLLNLTLSLLPSFLLAASLCFFHSSEKLTAKMLEEKRLMI